MSLSSLSLGHERKVKCYNEYFVNGYVFHTEEYGHGRKTYNNCVCVKGSTCSELEVDYYGRLEEVVELQYHSEPKGRVEVVQDEKEDTSVQDEVFQVSELVEPYRVAPSIDLEENSNFHFFDDSLVDVDAEELNIVLISSGQANIDEDDDDDVCCYPFLGSHTKNEKIQNIYIKKYSEEIQKVIGVRKGCWNTHKMARNWLRRFKNTRIEI